MALHPYAELNVHFQLLEHFTIIVYDKTSDLQYVNEARQEMFRQKESQWRDFPQPKTPCCSTLSMQPIKLEYGPPVIRLSSVFLLQNTGDRLLQRTPGFLCG